MGYTKTRKAMGDILGTITTAIDVANDPYMPEIVCRVNQLKAVDRGEAVSECTSLPPGLQGGVGLHSAMGPLRAYVYAQRNPWVYGLAIAALIGIPMYIGYELGGGG